ncbi:hypothetical protein BS47DRAFT_537534 [Hydnum rufescens UP504]|uniref:Uncharacterized protein n=1 Tax=Hydnum rufescens UP504 TaxID=1448309 RepID=A0A9P6AGR6_9AGAM|nr:hypothetical protein BS47DRAFT_537534 [Hydnum rufescens UP504]
MQPFCSVDALTCGSVSLLTHVCILSLILISNLAEPVRARMQTKILGNGVLRVQLLSTSPHWMAPPSLVLPGHCQMDKVKYRTSCWLSRMSLNQGHTNLLWKCGTNKTGSSKVSLVMV